LELGEAFLAVLLVGLCRKDGVKYRICSARVLRYLFNADPDLDPGIVIALKVKEASQYSQGMKLFEKR
jgi:hypothetical protein